MHTVKAIILKSIPHSEQQQILHVYSEERGYMQMITPLALFKRKANASAQCMQIVETAQAEIFLPACEHVCHLFRRVQDEYRPIMGRNIKSRVTGFRPESRSIRVYQNLRGIPEHHAG